MLFSYHHEILHFHGYHFQWTWTFLSAFLVSGGACLEWTLEFVTHHPDAPCMEQTPTSILNDSQTYPTIDPIDTFPPHNSQSHLEYHIQPFADVYYLRRPLQLGNHQEHAHDQPTNNTSLLPDPRKNNQGTTSSNLPKIDELDDRPIALRKIVR